MESETSPDLIKDFTENLETIIRDQNLQNRMNNMNYRTANQNQNMSVLIKD